MHKRQPFASDKAIYTIEDDDASYLGGGQTAAVYRVKSSADEKVYALKLLVDAAYEQRFFQEVGWLMELANAPDENSLVVNGHNLTPKVYDEQKRGEQRFFVMDLAPGEPLDELLRRKGSLEEPQALEIASQLAHVFAVLHTVLRRSYQDFQPRNVFWDKQKNQIMVIDWNQLSEMPKKEEDTLNVSDDLKSIGFLLYRMLLGVMPPLKAETKISGAPDWQGISLSARILLQDLLRPRTGFRITDAREAHNRIEELNQLWQMPGDDLVIDAGNKFKDFEAQPKKEIAQKNTYLRQTAERLELAKRKTVSKAVAIVQHNLEQQVENLRHEWSALSQGIRFFESGEMAIAMSMFETTLDEVEESETKLHIQRWRGVVGNRSENTGSVDGEMRKQVIALMEKYWHTTLAYLDSVHRADKAILTWDELQEEVGGLVGSGLNALNDLEIEATVWPMLLALQESKWEALPGDSAKKQFDLATAQVELAKGLPYANDLWVVLSLGLNASSEDAINQALDNLKKAVKSEIVCQEVIGMARNGSLSAADDRLYTFLADYDVVPIPRRPLLNLVYELVGAKYDIQAGVIVDHLAAGAKIQGDLRNDARQIADWLRQVQRVEQFLESWQGVVNEEIAPAKRDDSTLDSRQTLVEVTAIERAGEGEAVAQVVVTATSTESGSDQMGEAI